MGGEASATEDESEEDPMKALTAKQQRFVEEYLVDMNATQAAIRAGYSAKTAEQGGAQLLGNIKVAAAVKEGRERLAQKAGVTAEKVVAEYAKLGFANMLDYIRVVDGSPVVDMSTINRDMGAAIGEVTSEVYMERTGDPENPVEPVKRTKFKLADKKGALDSLARHLGMFTERHEHSGPDGGPIPNKYTVEFVNATPQDQPEARTPPGKAETD